jgi:hypothetical protein
MKKVKRPVRIQCVSLIVGLVLACVAHADFKREYGAGVKDYNNGDYAKAIEKLQKAIDEEPNSQEQVRIYGMRYEPYIPHFYLGQAKFKNGDCVGALKAWNESISQGVIKKQALYSELQTGMAACESAKVDVTLIAKAAEEAIKTLEDNIDSFGQLQNEKWLSSEWSSRWEPELNTARTSATSLKQRLATAVGSTDETGIKTVLDEAKKAANAISGSRSIAMARADSLKGESAKNELNQRSDARQALTRAVEAGKSVKFSQGNEQMASLQKQLEELLQRGSATIGNDAASPQEYLEIAQNISNVSRRYASAEQDWQTQQRLAQSKAEDAAAAQAAIERRIPPAVLKQVAEAYFAGKYKEVIELSNPNALKEDRAKVQALLFRAAANYKLYALSGETNAQALKSSEEDIRAIKRLNKSFQPYIAAFSPKFLELFRQTA